MYSVNINEDFAFLDIESFKKITLENTNNLKGHELLITNNIHLQLQNVYSHLNITPFTILLAGFLILNRTYYYDKSPVVNVFQFNHLNDKCNYFKIQQIVEKEFLILDFIELLSQQAIEHKTEISFDNKRKFKLGLIVDITENNLNNIIFKISNDLINEYFPVHYIKTFELILNQLLNILVNKPYANKNISDIHYLSANDYNKIFELPDLAEYNYNDKTVSELFTEIVKRYSDKIALVFKNQCLTYKELDQKANQLANYLITMNIVKPNDKIGLFIDRSQFTIISILAILKVGSTYVPIEPMYPDNRVCYILVESEIKLILTDSNNESKLIALLENTKLISEREISNYYIELVDNNDIYIDSSSALPIINKQNSDSLIYIIYTSGTTGKPKGVMQTHENVVRLFSSTDNIFKFNDKDVWTMFHSYAFDFSVWEMFGALLYGGELVIPTYEQVRDPESFYNLCHEKQVSVLNQTPTAFYQFMSVALANNKDKVINHLRYVIFGGEVLDFHKLGIWVHIYPLKQVKLINMYGITEVTVHTTYKFITADDIFNHNSLIGVSLPDQKAYVLNDYLYPVPIGAIGELYISGNGLSPGYINQPVLTQDHFISNPFYNLDQKGLKSFTRLYRTGDLVKWISETELAYIGRADLQVKIRGYRIELEEIQNVLNIYPGVKQSVVLVFSHNERKHHSTYKYLAGFYVSDTKLDEYKLFKHLQKFLPYFMVPSILIHLDKIPLNINGKLDKDALPKPKFKTYPQYSSPVNDLEFTLCEIFIQILGLYNHKIGTTDDFFKLGGNSVLAIKLTNKINNEFFSHLKIVDIFINRNVKQLSMAILNSMHGFKIISNLNDVKGKPNLFMIHPAMSGSEVYVSLAKKLSDHYSCFGLDNYNLNNENQIDNISQLARLYLSAIDEVREATNERMLPYNLFGWSLGGQVALEIASILEQRGFTKIKVILLDTVLADDELKKYLSFAKKDRLLLYSSLVTHGHIENYSNKLEQTFYCEDKMVLQNISTKLSHSKILLFKAQKYANELIHNHNKINEYVLQLPFNNIDLYTESADSIKLIKLEGISHYEIFLQEEFIFNSLIMWENTKFSNIESVPKKGHNMSNPFNIKSDGLYKLMDVLGANIYWKDKDGRYLGCNKSMLKLAGTSNLTDVVGKTDYDFWWKQDAPIIRETDILTMENGIYYGEEYVMLPSGEKKTFLSIKNVLNNDNNEIVGIAGVSLDVTEHYKRIEYEKQQVILGERYKVMQIIDIVNASIYWKDREGRVLGCNKYMLDMFGMKNKSEIIGKTDYDLYSSSKEIAHMIREMDINVMENGPNEREEAAILNGEERVYLSAKNKLLDSNGNVVGVVGTSIDITDRKEKESLEIENEVHKKVIEEQERFKKITDQMVHDIRSPLSSLLMVLKTCDALPESTRIVLRDIASSIHSIANNVLNCYNIESSNIPSENISKPNILFLLLRQVITEKRFEFKNLPIKFESDFSNDANFAFVNIDAIAFKRSISNLINNAVEACNNKSGNITIKLHLEGLLLKVTIQDDGKGISPDIIRKIEHGVPVTKGKQDGHGIGLSQVKEMVQLNNGKFNIESKVGNGTRITLSFPRIKSPEWIIEKIEIIDNSLILILDDDNSIHGAWDARLYPIIENYRQIEVKHFTHGKDLLDFVNHLTDEKKLRTLLLTDYELLKQDINGLDVLKQAKIKHSILVTSHYSKEEILNSAIPYGAKVLPKVLTAEIPIIVNIDTNIQKSSSDKLVLIDDDKYFANTLMNIFLKDKNIDYYQDPRIFLDEFTKYPKRTKFYIDNNFKDIQLTGIDVAETLYKNGFLSIYILSGDDCSKSNIPAYVSAILKTDLDKIKEIANN